MNSAQGLLDSQHKRVLAAPSLMNTTAKWSLGVNVDSGNKK